MRSLLKILIGGVMLFITYTVIQTSLKSNLFEEWDYLAGIPWMRATLLDFYANVLIITLWVCYKEQTIWKKIIWIIALASLGSIATCGYALIQLFKLKEDEPLSAILIKRNP